MAENPSQNRKLFTIGNAHPLQGTQRMGHPPSFEVSGIGFGNNPVRSWLKLAGFLVERQDNTQYAENRFYSKAPVHTDQHEELLGEFERILAG